MKNRYLLISLLIIAATIVLSVGTYNRWWQLRLDIGPAYLDHLLAWIGFGFIGIYTPIYVYAKRRTRRGLKFLFAQQIGRPAQFYPDVGTGLALYISVCLMVISGFVMRFNLVKQSPKTWRFIHTSFVLPFYVLILIHVLHNVGII